MLTYTIITHHSRCFGQKVKDQGHRSGLFTNFFPYKLLQSKLIKHLCFIFSLKSDPCEFLAHLWGAHAIPLALSVAPYIIIKLWLKTHTFTYLTSSLKQPADGASSYARRFSESRLS